MVEGEVNLETLAAIAGQGGADPELDITMFEPVVASTPERILFSEGINVAQKQAE